MIEKKKVLWLIKGLGSGGAEKLLAMSLPYLNREKFDYQVVYFTKSVNDLVPQFEQAGIPVICLDVEKSYDIKGVFRLARTIRQRKIDIVHIQSPYWGIIARIIGRIVGVKIIISTEHQFLKKLHPVVRLGSILTYFLNDATIGVSQAMVKSLQKCKTVRKKDLYTIPNGIDINATRPSHLDTTSIKEKLGIDKHNSFILNVANFKPQKGHQYLIMAAPLILKKCPQTTFVLVGVGKPDVIERLENMVDQLGIRKNVIFAGFRSDVPELMSACDVFVLPSLWEPFGIVLLEAMALGKTVIGTNVGGIPEVIDDGINGFLVEPGNSQQLAEKTQELLLNEKLRNQMGQNGMRKVQEKFSIQQMVGAIEQVYVTVINRKSGSQRT